MEIRLPGLPQKRSHYVPSQICKRSGEKRTRLAASVLSRMDYSRICVFGPPDVFADFVTRLFRIIFVRTSAQKNPPGKSPAKSSKIYTTKIPDTSLQRGKGNKCLPSAISNVKSNFTNRMSGKCKVLISLRVWFWEWKSFISVPINSVNRSGSCSENWCHSENGISHSKPRMTFWIPRVAPRIENAPTWHRAPKWPDPEVPRKMPKK